MEHYFPIPGHTLLPSDQDFGHIEKYVRRHVQDVYSPVQWVKIIEKSCAKTKFVVTHMTREDFKGLLDLKKIFTFRNKNESKESVVEFSKAVKYSFSAESHMKLKISHCYNASEMTVNLCPRGQCESLNTVSFSLKYEQNRKIDRLKMKDL